MDLPINCGPTWFWKVFIHSQQETREIVTWWGAQKGKPWQNSAWEHHMFAGLKKKRKREWGNAPHGNIMCCKLCQLLTWLRDHYKVLAESWKNKWVTGEESADTIGFSLNVAFCRYHIWLKFILWKGRYRWNKTGPYHDPGYSVLQYWIPIQNLVPLFPESLAMLKVPACRCLGHQKAYSELQILVPPMGHNCQTCFSNNSVPTEPFPTIPTALYFS